MECFESKWIKSIVHSVKNIEATSMLRLCRAHLVHKTVRKCKDAYWRTPFHTLSDTIDMSLNKICSILSSLSNGLILSIKGFECHLVRDFFEVIPYFFTPVSLIRETFRKNIVRKSNSQTLTSSENVKRS